MRRLLRFATAACLLAAISLPAAAMRSEPEPTLWAQVDFSETIVLADVVSAEAFASSDGSGDTHRAVLKVVETWKGPAKDTIEIEYPGYVVCPSPGRFVAGKRMVAFLFRWQSRLIASGDNATRYAEGQSLEDLRVMVRSALEIQSSGASTAELHDRKRRWMVEAVERSGTRSDGLDGLSSHTAFEGPDFKLTRQPEFPDLDDQDKQRLARLFVKLAAGEEWGAMLSLLPILEGYDDPLVDAATAGLYEKRKNASRSEGWIRRLDRLTCARRGTCPAAAGSGS